VRTAGRHPERAGETRTLVDLNRCGVPLIEIVSVVPTWMLYVVPAERAASTPPVA
jgi:Asp-tRNA(Asn)/Glu-tRNA(Gln) amidotransferase B subunit